MTNTTLTDLDSNMLDIRLEEKRKREAKRIEKKLAAAQSTDGVEPLFNAEDLPTDIVKKLNNQDKHFKKEQRTKVLNIINKTQDIEEDDYSLAR